MLLGVCRRDTWSDLQLSMALNCVLVLLGGYLKATLLDSAMDHGVFSEEFWQRIYSVGHSPLICFNDFAGMLMLTAASPCHIALVRLLDAADYIAQSPA